MEKFRKIEVFSYLKDDLYGIYLKKKGLFVGDISVAIMFC